CQQYNSAPWTF
nr:immunoglobulin light chain junction region [Macaca mulatta]MOV74356.1 immunoglobulin light chain junction region [Macaca mulatta]MOV74404.1 immunoglobulin light chain junction region [Macaca mulatta]MOV75360.1 immunoglobulin light chain junction region [Macaca mulatta]MOV75694.1 immunoglobulin light chain junction region [Macaca mulatta]